MAQPRRLNAGAVRYVFVMMCRELRSEFGAAVRAEERSRLVALAPAAATGDLERQGRAARRAELPALGLQAAAGAGDLGAGVDVEAAGPVLLAGRGPDLVALCRR